MCRCVQLSRGPIDRERHAKFPGELRLGIQSSTLKGDTICNASKLVFGEHRLFEVAWAVIGAMFEL